MTRTIFIIPLLAAAALAGCDNNEPIVVGGPGEDPANQAPVANGPVELPPSIAASKIYRCRDNSIVYIDWLSDQKSANFRPEQSASPVHLTAPEPGGPLTAEGYSLTGTAGDSTVTLARPDKGSQPCKA